MSIPIESANASPAPDPAALPPDKTTTSRSRLSDVAATDLKQRTARGAVLSAGAQAATLVFRTGSMMIMARLLVPGDFGLVGMITAFTGFLGLFRDAGLSMATIQRVSVTNEQTSTLFWVNVAVGVLLALLAVVGAPILVRFYHEPRLFWVTMALGTSFLFNGAGAQHRAMLQRGLKFGTLAGIDIVSLLVSSLVGIVMAMAGFGYWSLVGTNVGQPAAALAGVWLASRWIPGRPRRGSGVRSMLLFGGTITLNSVVMYVAYNADKVLLGRFWGSEALGIYGRAYQLINLPTENLNSTLGSVAFPALSRVQDDPERLRRYFLKGYSLFLALVTPITMGCALFADDIVRVFLGAKWHEASAVFRLMAPTIIIFALVNPLAWLMVASGRAGRSLRIAFVIAPVIVLGYVIGLRNGPHGVAAGFTTAMALLVVPIVWWAKHGTLITGRDILSTVMKPFLSILLGAAATWAAGDFVAHLQPTFLRLVVESGILFGVYLLVLLFGMKQMAVYVDLFRATGLLPSRFRAAKGTAA